MRAIAVALLLGQLWAPGWAQERGRRDLTLDPVPLGFRTTPVRPKPIDYRLFPGVDPRTSSRQGHIPFIPIISIRLDEGPVLESLVWGGTGALVGSFMGPAGTLIGASVGVATGLLIARLYTPTP